MIREDKVIGAIGTAHRDAKPFSEQQVALLKSFADQAVIAIENATLLNALRQRTDDLTRSLRGPAKYTGPPCPDAEAGLAWSTDCGNRSRDQEPAQFR